MCGIIFTYNSRLESSRLKEVASNALLALRHRGPDDAGEWYERPVAIGHRRLAIIDLADSKQPMISQDGNFILSYNGEIYNYQELRGELERRWRFRTKGDTEVLLAGLVLHGANFCKKMEGMWAFALWDRKAQILIMGRDRIGKKPLYYQIFARGISCASELPALAHLTPVWEEDLNSTADYLRYGYYLPGTTAYQNVSEILPGCTATWQQKNNRFTQQSYWTLPTTAFNGSKEAARGQLMENFHAAVKRRLIADVEVGAFLSGGIDSSLVVSLLTKEFGLRPKTFTIGFQETTYDERKYARTIAQDCHTEHYEEILESMQPATLEGLIQSHIGQPFADPSILPMSLVSKLAAKYVKVALSGDGADELFCGYQRYQARVLFRWYSRLPKSLRNNIERIIKAFPEPMVSHSQSILKKAHLFCQAANRLRDESPYVGATYYTHKQFSKLAPDLAEKGHAPPNLPTETSLDDLQTMMAMDALVYLPQDILLKVDRATMAYSLEARAPFLDTKLVELAYSLPSNWHRHGFSGKRMLRDTFKEKLPSSIWQRRKQGFAVPINQWFRGKLGVALEDMLSTELAPFDHKEVTNLLLQHRNGQTDYAFQLWAAYIYLSWRNSPIFSIHA